MDDSTRVGWRAEERPCPGCGSGSFRRLGRRGGAAHHARLGIETTIVRCRSCHLVYPRPFLLPDKNPYDAYSSADYFHAHESSAKIANGRLLARRAAELLGRVGLLLELGCGRGELLLGARDQGWDVLGVDMTASWAGEAADLPVELASVEQAQSLDQPDTYDAILLAAILEHLYDPALCLRRVHAALSRGGLVFIDVPNECGLWTRAGNAYMRARGRDWAINLSPTFPPFHVVGFCPASLRKLLASCGFDIVELTTHRWQNELPARPGPMARAETLAAELALTLGASIGMGAGITCWARKQ